MARVVHFEIHAESPERAVDFYQGLFGWTCRALNVAGQEYWLVTTGEAGPPGIDGGMIRRRGAPPADGQAINAYVCTIQVESIDQVLASLPARGGQVVVPVMPVPGVGRLAYAKDTEGNVFGVLQPE